MAEVDVFDIEIHHNETLNGQKNNSDSDDELLEIEEVKFNDIRPLIELGLIHRECTYTYIPPFSQRCRLQFILNFSHVTFYFIRYARSINLIFHSHNSPLGDFSDNYQLSLSIN